VRLALPFLLVVACSKAAATTPDAGSPCGDMPCTLYDSPEAAFARVLEDRPAVLAIGETHAQRDFDGASTTERFAEKLLPVLRGRSKDLVVELWVGNPSCNTAQKRAMKQVASAQAEVTASQRPKNQSEFVALYNAARKNDMKAHVLVPPCDDYDKIVHSPDDLDSMLEIIARLSAAEVTKALPAENNEPVLVYGGAMHNDLMPRPGHERWSFGPELDHATDHRYVELDLIVPEMISESDAWMAQPWYPHYDAHAQGKKTILFRTRPRSYALIFAPAIR